MHRKPQNEPLSLIILKKNEINQPSYNSTIRLRTPDQCTCNIPHLYQTEIPSSLALHYTEVLLYFSFHCCFVYSLCTVVGLK